MGRALVKHGSVKEQCFHLNIKVEENLCLEAAEDLRDVGLTMVILCQKRDKSRGK